MPRDISFRLQDIIDSIKKIQDYIADIDFDAFEKDTMRQDAVMRNLEIIGEATTHVPISIQEKYTDIPWVEMKRTRNILIHAYHAVRLVVVWRTIAQSLHPLIPRLEKILSDLKNPPATPE